MKLDDSMQEKINQIQVSEQSLNTLISQKQNFQAQLMEVESSLAEISKAKNAYRIIGNIMIASDVETLKNDLASKKEIIDLRIKTIQKQEDKLKQKISDTQKEVMESMRKK